MSAHPSIFPLPLWYSWRERYQPVGVNLLRGGCLAEVVKFFPLLSGHMSGWSSLFFVEKK